VDDDRRRNALRVCDYFDRGIYSADDACRQILFFSVEPLHAADYVGLLPDGLRVAFPDLLSLLPYSEQGWVDFHGVMQLDGDEWLWARTVAECRTNTEAVRECLLGVSSPVPASNFTDLVRAEYRARMDAVSRTLDGA
jgi:hypothetical protein